MQPELTEAQRIGIEKFLQERKDLISKVMSKEPDPAKEWIKLKTQYLKDLKEGKIKK